MNNFVPTHKQHNTRKMQDYHIIRGALVKSTNEYVHPSLANKTDLFVCSDSDCAKDVILCRGTVVRDYFRHKIDKLTQCTRYNHATACSESQLHADAKSAIKNLIDKNIQIIMYRPCDECKQRIQYDVPKITDASSVILEHRFTYNGQLKIADVAYITRKTSEIIGIFEIYHTHKTNTNDRPEPWFEIEAQSLLIQLSSKNFTLDAISIQCCRIKKCDNCEKVHLLMIQKTEKKNIAHAAALYVAAKKAARIKDVAAKNAPRIEAKRIAKQNDIMEAKKRKDYEKAVRINALKFIGSIQTHAQLFKTSRLLNNYLTYVNYVQSSNQCLFDGSMVHDRILNARALIKNNQSIKTLNFQLKQIEKYIFTNQRLLRTKFIQDNPTMDKRVNNITWKLSITNPNVVLDIF